jgi:superfamily II DNA/RNA helicase
MRYEKIDKLVEEIIVEVEEVLLESDNDEEEEEEVVVRSFRDMNLRQYMVRILESSGFYLPEPIQKTAIPLIIDCKDVMVIARTGSGKTGAYVIPLIQKIWELRSSGGLQHSYSLILRASRELCRQVTFLLENMSSVNVVDVSADLPIQDLKKLLETKPEIIVSTPENISTLLMVIIYNQVFNF